MTPPCLSECFVIPEMPNVFLARSLVVNTTLRVPQLVGVAATRGLSTALFARARLGCIRVAKGLYFNFVPVTRVPAEDEKTWEGVFTISLTSVVHLRGHLDSRLFACAGYDFCLAK